MNLAGELLDLGAQREAPPLDEKLFFEAFNARQRRRKQRPPRAQHR